MGQSTWGLMGKGKKQNREKATTREMEEWVVSESFIGDELKDLKKKKEKNESDKDRIKILRQHISHNEELMNNVNKYLKNLNEEKEINVEKKKKKNKLEKKKKKKKKKS